MFDVNKIVRKHILSLKSYSSARDEYTGTEGVFLDANENPYGSAGGGDFHRYPDPYQRKIKHALVGHTPALGVEQIFIGNGSDEAIDLLFRAFCEPLEDNVLIMPPTYGMYQVSADINRVAIREVPLNKEFAIQTEKVLAAIDEHTRMIFVCSPNNPTGNTLSRESIETLLNNFDGLLVVDEAYIDFSPHQSWVHSLKHYPNLVVLQTLSKSWGLAGLRLGMAFASKEVIGIVNKIKPPYNINEATQQLALKALENREGMQAMVADILQNKSDLEKALLALPLVKSILPSDANFIMAKFEEPKKIYTYLTRKLVIVRDRSSVLNCEGYLRITVGSEEENKTLLKALKAYPEDGM
ncbi:histidinol-phosphate transaminase [Rapidithrix thailandica]|uniref:Histidinol-phosphate aminotransferase n=1 Tax=Rapidithrix thailandica TaxID=413964 RepID=A0AAW9SE19_9BACT